jgi:hypothetical protein
MYWQACTLTKMQEMANQLHRKGDAVVVEDNIESQGSLLYYSYPL